jgi:outer membrane receptor protein involved in Fe transport
MLAETLSRVKEEANLKPGEVLACRDSFADVADRFPAYQQPRLTKLQCLFENEGYARLDAGLSYRAYRSLELYGRLYNLLDKHYEEVLGYSALPLNFVAALRFTFPAE